MKKKSHSKLQRLFAVTILLSMLFSTAACGDSSNDNKVTKQENTTTTEPAETRATSIPSGLDLTGKEVKVLWWLEQNECTDEQNGEIVNDALYDRDRAVEERLGVTLTNLPRSYTWAERAVYLDMIRTSVMSNDNAFDLVSGQYAVMPSLIPDGALLALNETKYINFNNPWWARGLVDETAINGKVYVASGEIATSNVKNLSCFFYNKRLVEEYSLENPYTIVSEGKWTIDKLFGLTRDIYSDLDNDGKKSLGDFYGCLFYSDNLILPLVHGTGCKMAQLGKDGKIELTYGSERMVNVMDKLDDFLYNASGSFMFTSYATELWNASGSYSDVKDAFNEGRGIFIGGTVNDAKMSYNNMKDDFGVLPMPKYDESQENYITLVGETNTLFGIVSSTADPDAASAVMEALCEENYYTVTPAYYEVAMKVKYSRDDESAQMFDLIRETASFDFGRIYVNAAKAGIDVKESVVRGKSWSTYFAGKKDAAETAFNSFIEEVEKLG